MSWKNNPGDQLSPAAACLKSLLTVTIPQALTDAEGITLKYDARALTPKVTGTDEIIACALLKSDELLMARQFIGYNSIGTIHLNYPALQAEQVECCYVFVRSGDGKKLPIRCMWK